MVKKRMADGEPCRKCRQTEEMLIKRGLWERIDEVVWAVEGEPESPGFQLASQFDVENAPFFVVEEDGQSAVYTSALKLIKEKLTESHERKSASAGETGLSLEGEIADIRENFGAGGPLNVMEWTLKKYGSNAAIAFSGAEDVVLIHMAVRSGFEFSVFCLDTGRLHPETYRFIEKVRTHYGITIELVSPEADVLENFVRQKGLFSFYEDGHKECCGIRKVAPLKKQLSKYAAWMTGQRKDQSPTTRGELKVIEIDSAFKGAEQGPLVKVNPLVNWSSKQVWGYIRSNEIPYNELHDSGFISIGCAPCTRAIRPSEHERAGRWWWEEATKKECGLHSKD